jgi:preprotein translocase subunit Sss1
METDYTIAIASVIGLVLLLTGMVGFVLTRPTDYASDKR